MSQYPEDIMEAAKVTYEGLPLCYDGWDEDAVIEGIAAAIFAERVRGAAGQIKTLESVRDDLRRQCDTLVKNWSADLGETFETKAAGAASYIISEAATSIEIELMKLDKITTESVTA